MCVYVCVCVCQVMLHSKDKVSCAKHSLGREAPLAPQMPSSIKFNYKDTQILKKRNLLNNPNNPLCKWIDTSNQLVVIVSKINPEINHGIGQKFYSAFWKILSPTPTTIQFTAGNPKKILNSVQNIFSFRCDRLLVLFDWSCSKSL